MLARYFISRSNVRSACQISSISMRTRIEENVRFTPQRLAETKINSRTRFFKPPLQIRRFSEEGDTILPISEKISEMVDNNKVVVFMKGVPESPMCGFSNAVVQLLRMHGVENYDAHNVLEDDDLRQGIKDFSDWPTIPQVYFNGEFVGGCDIMLQLHQNGELIDELKKIGIESALAKD